MDSSAGNREHGFRMSRIVAVFIALLFVIPASSAWSEQVEPVGDIGKVNLFKNIEEMVTPQADMEIPEVMQGNTISVGKYVFDPLVGLPDIASHLKLSEPSGYYLVQFDGPVQQSWLGTVESAGADVQDYMPTNTHFVEMRPSVAAKVRTMDFVRWVGIYQPAYKFIGDIPVGSMVDVRLDVFDYRAELMRPEGMIGIHEFPDSAELEAKFPTLKDAHKDRGTLAKSVNDFSVDDVSPKWAPLDKSRLQISTPEQVHKDMWLNRIESPITSFGGSVVTWRGDDVIHIRVPSTALSGIARIPFVKYVGEWTENKPLMDVIVGADPMTGTSSGWALGYDGSTWSNYFAGEVIPGVLLDNGIDPTHGDIDTTQVKRYGATSNDDGSNHGTSTTGIIFGKGVVTNPGQLYNVASNNARGGFAMSSNDENTMKDSNQLDNGYFSSHSYYSGVNDGWYDARSNELDGDLFADQAYVYFFGSGNVPNADGEYVTGEGCAKNVVTVGGIYPGFGGTAAYGDDSWGNDGCHGPTDYGAIGVDVSHHYQYVTTTWNYAEQADGEGEFSGTSAATPIIAGMGGQFVEAWLDDYWGNNPGHTLPTCGATVKAALINTADHDNFGNDGIGRYEMGWGFPHNDWLFDGRGWIFHDYSDTRTANSGGTVPAETVPTTTTWPLRVTLTWYDPAGGAAGADDDTTNRLVSDLNLRVVDLNSGDTYYGNMGMLMSQATAPNAGVNPWSGGGLNPDNNYDDLNTVENVWIPNPLGHTFEVYVEGGPQVSGSQGFSLVISGTPPGVGKVWFEEDGYWKGERVEVTLVDADNNTNFNGIDTAQVRISSGKDPTGTTLTLTETAVNSSTFEGYFYCAYEDLNGYNDGLTHSEAETGGAPILAAYEVQDTLRVDYYETDPAPRSAFDTCLYDGKPPRIYDVTIFGTTHQGFSVKWETDEPTYGMLYLYRTFNDTGTKPDYDDSWLYLGSAWSMFDPSVPADLYDPDAWISALSLQTSLSTHHEVTIVGLYPDETFIFDITAIDHVRESDGYIYGNSVTDDNGGEFYQFHTPAQAFEILTVADDNYDMWDGFIHHYYNVYYSDYFGRVMWTTIDSFHSLYGEWNETRDWTGYLDYFTPTTLGTFWSDMRTAQSSGVDNIVVWTVADMCAQISTTVGTELDLYTVGMTDTFNSTDQNALNQWKATGAANTLIQGVGIQEDSRSAYDTIQGVEGWIESYAQVTLPQTGDEWLDEGSEAFDGTGAYVSDTEWRLDANQVGGGNLWTGGATVGYYTAGAGFSGDAFQLNGATGELIWGEEGNGVDELVPDDHLAATSTDNGQKLLFAPGGSDLGGMAGMHSYLWYADQGGLYYDTSYTNPVWQGLLFPWWMSNTYLWGGTYIEGNIYESDGITPIVNASVQAYAPGDRTVILGGGKTDATGYYRMNCTGDTYDLIAVKDGYQDNDTWHVQGGGSGAVTIAQGTTVSNINFLLSDDVGHIEGYVHTFDPYEGYMEVYPLRVRVEGGSGFVEEVTTNYDAYYHIENLPLDYAPYTITAYSKEIKNLGYTYSGFESYVETGFIPTKQSYVWKNYTLRSASIVGTVTDSDTGQPIQGARVLLWEQNQTKPRYVSDWTTIRYDFTGEDGMFQLWGVGERSSGHYLEVDANGMYTISYPDGEGGTYTIPEPWGYANSTAYTPSVTYGDITVQDVVLDRIMGRIFGYVTESGTGNPISGAQVSITQTSPGWMVDNNGAKQTTYTDALGYYSFDVHPGTYDVKCKKQGYVEQTQTGQTVANDQQKQVDFVMAVGFSVGTILMIFDWNMTQSRGNGGWSGPNDMFLTAIDNLGYTFDSWNISWNDGSAMYIDENVDGLPTYDDLAPYDLCMFYGMDGNIYPEMTSLGGPWAPAVMQYMDGGGSWVHMDHEWRYGAGAETQLMTDYMMASYIDDGTDEATNAGQADSVCPADDPVGGTNAPYNIPASKTLQAGTAGSPGSGYQYEDRIEGQVNLFDNGAGNINMAIRTEGEAWKAAWFGFAITDYTATVDTVDADFQQLIKNLIDWGSVKLASAPIVSDPAVTPSEGAASMVYNYTFTWTDAEGDWPITTPKLVVEPGDVLEEKFDMNAMEGAAPIVPTEFTYVGTTVAGGPHDAYENEVDNPAAAPTGANLNLAWAEAIQADYDAIEADGGTTWVTIDPGVQDEPIVRFDFDISGITLADIDHISIHWDGRTAVAGTAYMWYYDIGAAAFVAGATNAYPAAFSDMYWELSGVDFTSYCQGNTFQFAIACDDTSDSMTTDLLNITVWAPAAGGGDSTDGAVYYYELPASYFAGRLGMHEYQFEVPGDGTFNPVGATDVQDGPLIWDTIAPSVTVTDLWAQQMVGNTILVNATVTDNVDVGQVRLYWDDVGGGTTWNSVPMSWSGNLANLDEYAASIPAQSATGTVIYYVWASDTNTTANTATDPAGAPGSTYSITIIAPSTPALASGNVNGGETASGSAGDEFNLEVTYSDAHSKEPWRIEAFVDGSWRTMTYVSGAYDTGALYRFVWNTTGVADGSYNYFFRANARMLGSGELLWATGDNNTLHGPIDIGSIVPRPTLSGGTGEPTPVNTGEPIWFNVTYNHTLGLAPTLIECEVNGSWNAMVDQGGDYVTGRFYSYMWATGGNDNGDYNYRFRTRASDGEWGVGQNGTLLGPVTVINGPNDVPKPVLGLGMTVNGANQPVLNWTLQSELTNRTRSEIRIFRNASRDGFNYSTDLVYTAGVSDTTWTDTSVSSGTYYYYVRPYNVIGLSALSTLGVYHTFSFTYNAGIGNDNWISMPHTSDYVNASDIVLDIEGALSPGGVDVYINYIGKWDPATQGVTESFFYQEVGPPALWGWNGGADFVINPGDSITIQLSGNTGSFDWQVAGTDVRCTRSFTYNAGIGNDNWITVPWTGQYTMASDIVLDIEGALSPGGVDVYINYIGKWDPATQGVTESFFYQEVGPPALWGWTGGADFVINPGDGITLQLSGNTASFNWLQLLTSDPLPDATYP